MTKIPSVEERVAEHTDPDTGLLNFGKYDHEAFRRFLTADRLALLTELREWSVKQDWPVSKRDEGLAFQEKLGHNEAHEDLQAHLDELIKSNSV